MVALYVHTYIQEENQNTWHESSAIASLYEGSKPFEGTDKLGFKVFPH